MTYQRALIVDDSKLARVSLKKKLERRGLETVMAEGAKEALALLQNTPVDVVFMDHLMPDMDGFQATREIKANKATAHLPVIMCSGKDNEGYLQEAQAIGASNILSKPPKDDALTDILSALEKSSMRVSTHTLQDVPPAAANEEQIQGSEHPDTLGEDKLSSLISPLSDQVNALASQLNTLSRDIEDRLAASGKVMALMEQNQSSSHFDQTAFKHELSEKMEERLATLELPQAEEIESRVKQALAEQVSTQLAQRVDELQHSLQARMQSLQEEKENTTEEAPVPDLAEFRKALYEDIMAELALQRVRDTPLAEAERAHAETLANLKLAIVAHHNQVSRKLAGFRWLATGSFLVAATAIALHWVV